MDRCSEPRDSNPNNDRRRYKIRHVCNLRQRTRPRAMIYSRATSARYGNGPSGVVTGRYTRPPCRAALAVERRRAGGRAAADGATPDRESAAPGASPIRLPLARCDLISTATLLAGISRLCCSHYLLPSVSKTSNLPAPLSARLRLACGGDGSLPDAVPSMVDSGCG